MLERKRNMTGDEELDVLLDEIPHATSNDHHRQQLLLNGNNNILLGHGMYYSCPSPSVLMHGDCNKYTCASPMSGFSLRSDDSSLSLFSSAGHSPSDNGSPNPSPLDEFKSQMHCGNSHSQNEIWIDSKKSPDSPIRRNANGSWTDELGGLARNLNKMCIGNAQEDDSNFKNFFLDSNRLEFCDKKGERFEAYEGKSHGSTNCVGFHSPVSRSGFTFDCEMGAALVGLHKDYRNRNLSDSQMCHGPADFLCRKQTSNFCYKGSQVSDLSTYLNRLSMADSLLYAQLDPVNWSKEREASNLPNRPHWTCENPHISLENMLHYGLPITNGRTGAPSSIRISQAGLEGFNCEDSFIVQGEGLNYAVNKGFVHTKGQNKGTLHDIGLSNRKYTDRSQLHGCAQIPGILENAQSARMCSPVSLPLKYNSMAQARGYVYLMAKDQHGCRFLQRMFDEGTPQDVRTISNEVVNHMAELMINPFGNYLVQKLLEICNDEQRTQIVLILTQEPGQLVRISLNTHGTRVVQKLIETLKTRQQISLLVSALEPGFLALIKDLNGNHVIQHCLQCLSNDDNKFIFFAAAKHCVDIATHQHGCCVLQRCIGFSTGKHRQNLVAEISANGLLLAQDAYGNYVLQFVLELKLPSATSKLISQFEGNYVHLSTQKFSSHVVEKCLLTYTDESRSRIIHELLSAPHFQHLLQDPHANYVVQTALRVSEGPLHDSLVEAIESHKAISRNNPYSKRIFSQKLLKK